MDNALNELEKIAGQGGFGDDQLADMQRMIAAELETRQRSEFSPFLRYERDPVGFIENALLGFIWSKQKEIALSVLHNRRTAVKSCHDVGKSYIASRIAAWWLSCNTLGDAFLVSLAPTFHQVKAILWREIAKAHAAGRLPGYLNTTEWKVGSELIGFGRSPADNDPTAIQGIHAPRVLVVGDEACGLSKEILDGTDSLIANDDSRILLIGNPDDPSSEFANICKPGSGWNVIRINAFDSPNFTGEYVPERVRPLLISKTWVAEKAKSWGVDSPLYIAKVLGEFPEQANDALVPIAAVNAAIDRYKAMIAEGRRPTTEHRHDLGVDVAREGDDATVIYRRRDWTATLEHRHRKKDLMEVVGEIIRACRRDKPRRIKIDDAGMGGGVTDRLRQIQASQDPRDNEARVAIEGVEIVAVNVGAGPTNATADERFVNLRAQVNWNMRVVITEKPFALEPNDDLSNQIVQIKYKVPNGEIQIEKKADMKKRTKGVSPDDWDALVLAFAEEYQTNAGIITYMQQAAASLSPPPANAPKPTTVLVSPLGADGKPAFSTVYGMSGTVYSVNGGQIVVTVADDVQPLIGQGWQRLS